VGSPFTLVMNDVTVSEQRPAVFIERGHLVEGEIMSQHRGRICRIVRATNQIDNLHAGDSLLQPHGTSRIWVRSNQTSIPRASTDRDVSCRIGADMLCYFEGCLAGNRAVHTTVRRWNGTFDHSDVFSLVFSNYTFELLFSLLARACHNQFVIFPGKKVENEFRDCGIARAEHGFGIPSAVLKF
jgi:hypothetical protein